MKEETCEPSTTSDSIHPLGDITPSTPTARARGSKLSTTGAELALLTESRCQVARRCLREEKLRYVEGIVPATTADALRFGTLWHHGMEAWWLGIDGADRLGCALEALREHATPETDAYELARAEAMLIGYDVRWKREQLEVLGVELEFRAPLINPETGGASRTFQRGGKVDVVVRDATGRKFLVEHKTSSEDIGPGSSWWARLRMGGQAAGYIRGAEAVEHRVDGVIYDAAKKPELRPLKATPIESRKYVKGTGALYANQRDVDETVDEYRDRVSTAIAVDPDKYFQRGLVVRLDEQMAEADGELWQLGQTLREHHRLQLAPRNTDACQRYGQTCSYFAICAGEASADDERFYRRLQWAHPELTNPKEEG
jgi:hypothetical protein